MNTLEPINTHKQIFDVLEGKPREDMEVRDKKIKDVTDNIEKVIKVNGKKVYHPVVDGKYINYCLQKAPDWMKVEGKGRTHYYPIEYAEITFKQTK